VLSRGIGVRLCDGWRRMGGVCLRRELCDVEGVDV
jgi:hypothetical protein